MKYFLITNPENEAVLFAPEIGCIPQDTSNRDYNEYLIWVADGNTPQPFKPSSK